MMHRTRIEGLKRRFIDTDDGKNTKNRNPDEYVNLFVNCSLNAFRFLKTNPKFSPYDEMDFLDNQFFANCDAQMICTTLKDANNEKDDVLYSVASKLPLLISYRIYHVLLSILSKRGRIDKLANYMTMSMNNTLFLAANIAVPFFSVKSVAYITRAYHDILHPYVKRRIEQFDGHSTPFTALKHLDFLTLVFEPNMIERMKATGKDETCGDSDLFKATADSISTDLIKTLDAFMISIGKQSSTTKSLLLPSITHAEFLEHIYNDIRIKRSEQERVTVWDKRLNTLVSSCEHSSITTASSAQPRQQKQSNTNISWADAVVSSSSSLQSSTRILPPPPPVQPRPPQPQPQAQAQAQTPIVSQQQSSQQEHLVTKEEEAENKMRSILRCENPAESFCANLDDPEVERRFKFIKQDIIKLHECLGNMNLGGQADMNRKVKLVRDVCTQIDINDDNLQSEMERRKEIVMEEMNNVEDTKTDADFVDLLVRIVKTKLDADGVIEYFIRMPWILLIDKDEKSFNVRLMNEYKAFLFILRACR
jgi:hypothetical protein